MIWIAALTHQGLVRSRNEDAIVLPGTVLVGSPPVPVELRLPSADGELVAVVDGMGGHAGGQVASRIVALRLAEGGTETEELLNQANDAVYEEMGRQPHLMAMGATVAVVRLEPSKIVVFNVGDTRVYLYKSGYATVVTADDRRSDTTNVLTQSIGGTSVQTQLQIQRVEISVDGAMRLLLCTDGLSDVVGIGSIESALGAPLPGAAVIELVSDALRAGAPDNVSVAVIDLSPDGGGHP